jgi:rod shape determining protein RodA
MLGSLINTLQGRLKVDWVLFAPALLISLAGLVTMDSFSEEQYFFIRQSIWILVSVVLFFIASSIDWRFIRRTRVILSIFVVIIILLVLLFGLGYVAKGALSWFNLGFFALQPSDPAKFVTILMLAKYFSRRHIEIANARHIIVSGLYAFAVFILVFFQPDFGGAVTIFLLWVGMLLVSGISKKHLAVVAGICLVAISILWLFVFAPYQKARIINFIHPLENIHSTGYNAYQSTIAVGSGQVLGKGIGQGSQSKLLFLPEYQTDFIFAAFAEEWGLIGSILLLLIFGLLLFRIIDNAQNLSSNFDTLFGLGLAVLFIIHIFIHVGMNMGFLPVTGLTLPFMSYGGSHLLTEWFALGILSSMRMNSLGPRV